MSGAEGRVTPEEAAEVRALEPAVRLRLAGKVGVPTGKDDARLAEAVAAALATPEGAARVLASLSPDARELVRLRCCYGESLAVRELSSWARDEFGWTKPRFAQAHAEVASCGLFWSPPDLLEDDSVASLLAFDRGQRSTHPAWSAGAGPDARQVVPMGRRLALLVAYAFLEPVRRTKAGVPTAHWLEKAFACFAPIGTSIHQLVSEVNLLVAMGVLAASTEADRYEVVPGALEPLRERPIDLARAVLECAGTETLVHARGVLVGLARLRRKRHVGPATASAVQAALREVDSFALWDACRAPAEHFHASSLSRAAGLLRVMGLLTVEGEADGFRMTETPVPPSPPTRASQPATSRWIVQPNFEVLAPDDADPVAIAQLGGIADLVGTERVARFRLTQPSVARAASLPGGVEAAIERLRVGARHGLPDNVEATLSGWGRRSSVVRSFRGGVIVVGSDEQAALLRARPDVGAEVAPGVFHVAGAALGGILKHLGGLGHPVAPVTDDGREHVRGRTSESAAEAAARLERTLEKVAASMSAELRRKVEQEAREKADAAAAAKDRKGWAPSLSESWGAAALRKRADLRRGWPRTESVLVARPDLLRVMLALDGESLDLIEETASLRSMVSFLDKMCVELGLSPSDPERSDAGSDDDHEPQALGLAGGPVATESGGRSLGLSNDWRTLAIGRLEEILEAAAEDDETIVEIMYVDGVGETKARVILPLEVYREKRRVWLDAVEVGTGESQPFALDRIAAIRAAPDTH